MGGNIQIEIGQTVVIDGVDHEFKNFFRPRTESAGNVILPALLFEDVRTRCPLPITQDEFDTKFNAGEIAILLNITQN